MGSILSPCWVPITVKDNNSVYSFQVQKKHEVKRVWLVDLSLWYHRVLVGRSVSITSYPEAHPSLIFTMSPTTGSRSPPSLEPLILLLDTSLQVIDLKLSVSILHASMMSFECSPVPCYGALASVRFSAVCSLVSGFTPLNDSLKLLPHRLWQIRSSVPKIMYVSMFVLFKGSSIWCFVASACDAELLIVKAASVAVSIPGVRPVLVLSNSQSFISLLSTIGVEFRGLLSGIMCCLCVMFALILCNRD
ncbi:hypothetical protein Bca101_028970 [Brassica carinata]